MLPIPPRPGKATPSGWGLCGFVSEPIWPPECLFNGRFIGTHVVADTYTKEVDERSILLEVLPKGKTEWKRVLLSYASLVATKSDEARTRLSDVGAGFFSENWQAFHKYVEHLKPEPLLTQVKQTGWVDDQFKTFILPHTMLSFLFREDRNCLTLLFGCFSH
jgi:hypothetical protein